MIILINLYIDNWKCMLCVHMCIIIKIILNFMLKEELFDTDTYGIHFNAIWDMNVAYFNLFIDVTPHSNQAYCNAH